MTQIQKKINRHRKIHGHKKKLKQIQRKTQMDTEKDRHGERQTRRKTKHLRSGRVAACTRRKTAS